MYTDTDETIEFDGGEAPSMELLEQLVAQVGEEGLLPDELAMWLAHQESQSVQANPEHYENLAPYIDDTLLNKLASDIINWVEWDEQSRHDWYEREARGIKLLGVSNKSEGGATFEGASKVVHPLLAEAATQFHSRAIAEMWPPEGPVKAEVLGEADPEKTAQGERVKDYMNYLYTKQMPGGFEEVDKMLFRLPLSGSCFKKIYYDQFERSICSRLVEPADFIAPYNATDLISAPRYTHRIKKMRNYIIKAQRAGYFSDIPLTTPVNSAIDRTVVHDGIDAAEGRSDLQIDDDQPHTLLEMCLYLDLKGFEDIDPETGELTGIALPYVVTVDKDNQRVLRIQRNWKPDNAYKNKRVFYVHYQFSPGLGFYGYGLLHLIGGLSSSATGALRALMDSAQFANMQGGYRSRDSKVKGGDNKPLSPGEWREIDCSAEDLSKAFFKIPYEEPSETLFKLLGYLDERGQRFAGTTENMVGEANNSAPVGTTLALIEQGSKTFTAIHKRLHEAQGREFRIVAELCYENLPHDGYPYSVPGSDKFVMASDFDGRIDVIPVSDPNIISSTQRIAQAQAILDMADKYPQVINLKKAVENMMQALRVPNFKEFIVDQGADPYTEQLKQLELALKKAQVDKTVAEGVSKSIEGIYSALQAAAGVVSQPAIVPVGDQLYLSAGGQDKDGGSLANAPAAALPAPVDQLAPGFPANTDPRFPANTETPAQGMMDGIETPANDVGQKAEGMMS
jgi:hypothetical protein